MEKSHVEDPAIVQKAILNRIWKGNMEIYPYGLGLSGSEDVSLAACCEHANKPWSSIG
jgi:hypothetical protein